MSVRQDDAGLRLDNSSCRAQKVVCPNAPKRKGMCAVNSPGTSPPHTSWRIQQCGERARCPGYPGRALLVPQARRVHDRPHSYWGAGATSYFSDMITCPDYVIRKNTIIMYVEPR